MYLGSGPIIWQQNLKKKTLLPPALNNCRRFNELRTFYPIFCLNLRQVLRAGGSKSIPKITMLLTIKGRVSDYKSNLRHKKYILWAAYILYYNHSLRMYILPKTYILLLKPKTKNYYSILHEDTSFRTGKLIYYSHSRYRIVHNEIEDNSWHWSQRKVAGSRPNS